MATEEKTLSPELLKSILATDCGSTTTKAILIEKADEEYRLTVRGEAPDDGRGSGGRRYEGRAQCGG